MPGTRTSQSDSFIAHNQEKEVGNYTIGKIPLFATETQSKRFFLLRASVANVYLVDYIEMWKLFKDNS